MTKEIDRQKKMRWMAFLVVFLVLLVDQASKIWIKTNMSLYEMIEITSWFKIYFVENNGMAFGMEIIGKLFLSLFRIVAIGFIAYFLYLVSKQKNCKIGFIICGALIWAGAFGNIIDSIFYGVIFSGSEYGQVATFVPWGEGYSSLLHGKVVDMLYFPLFEFDFPSWIPKFGGEHFIFFSPIFNIADSAITVGIFLVLLFYRRSLSEAFDFVFQKRK